MGLAVVRDHLRCHIQNRTRGHPQVPRGVAALAELARGLPVFTLTGLTAKRRLVRSWSYPDSPDSRRWTSP